MPDAVSCWSRTCGRDGRRTRTTWWDGFYVTNDRLVTGELTTVRENGAASGPGVLATYAYDNLGRRTSLTRGNGTVTSTTYDPVSRLATLAENVTGTTNDQTATFSYNPAHQIGAVTKTNDAFAWTGHGSGSTASVANGLNQLASIGGAATMHDDRGNLTLDPTNGRTFTYSSENLLKVVNGGTTLHHDPLLRLVEYDTTISRRFVYDGVEIAAEVDNPAGAILQRFIRGDGADELIAVYTGSGTANRSWAHADERGSIVAQSDGGGNVTSINRYDEYGKPQSSNTGRFQYTGQMWLPETGAYDYKARMYAPHLGRFLQTDPIEYEGGLNLYAYVGNDPVNWTDPLGLQQCVDTEEEIQVCANPLLPSGGIGGGAGGGSNGGGGGAQVPGTSTLPPMVLASAAVGGENPPPENPEITVTGKRLKKLIRAIRRGLRIGAIINAIRSNTDLDRTIEMLRPPGVPKDWTPDVSKKGGIIWRSPNHGKHNYVRMRSDGTLIQFRDGHALDRFGNPVNQKSPAAHFPYGDFIFRGPGQ